MFTQTEQDVIESFFEPSVAVKALKRAGGFPPHIHGETHSLTAGRVLLKRNNKNYFKLIRVRAGAHCT